MAGTPFVGREPELASLKELRLRATRERSPAAVVVFGDPGSGKSRLLEEAAREAGQRLAMVGFEPERRIPLAAARPALRLLARVPEHGLGDRRERAEVSHEAAARLYDSVTRRSTAPSNEEPRPTE